MRTLLVLLAACGPRADAPIHNARAPDALVIAEHGVGPIDAKTHITMSSMQGLFPGRDITTKPANDSTIYNVMDKGDRLLYVVANADGSVFGVHVTSGVVANPTHGWRVGSKLASGVIDACECWGSPGTDEVAVCYKSGEHVAVLFERACTGLLTTPESREQLAGAVIARIVWQPNAWKLTPAPNEGM